MGAKNPADKGTRPMINKTCEDCQKDFQTISALKAHTMAKHPDKYIQMQKIDSENKTTTSRASKRLQKKNSVDNEDELVPSNSNVLTRKKIVFECPECVKVFQVYFSAFKHIQKRHLLDENGIPVSSDSMNLIKPVRREMCTVCSKLLNEDIHSCKDLSSIAEGTEGGYSCLGCEKRFISVATFDNHVPGTHSDSVDSMFFENYADFQMWKSNMESQVRVKYLTLSNTSNKQYYQCNYVSSKNSANVTHLCPSVLIVKEYPKGIQVHYYKKHYEHSCEYNIAVPFQKYLLNPEHMATDILENVSKNDENDQYEKFRYLLNNIIIDSATVNVTNLKKLHSMALQMQTFLNSFKKCRKDTDSLKTQSNLKRSKSSIDSNDQNNSNKQHLDKVPDQEIETPNKSMTDDQITMALEAPRTSARLKRKSGSSTPVPKNLFLSRVETDKNEASTPMPKKQRVESVKSDSSALGPKKQKIESENSTPVPKKQKVESDTFTPVAKKQKVESESSTPVAKKQKVELESSTPVAKKQKVEPESSTPVPKKQKVESEIATPVLKKQKVETESSSPVPKKQKVESDKDANENKSGLKENNSNSIKNTKFDSPKMTKALAINQSPSFNDSYKQFIDSTLNAPPKNKTTPISRKTNKKEIVKTKMGQFIPSPKKATVTKVDAENVDNSRVTKKKKETVKPPQMSLANIRIKDVKYEVVEQENDCNILVLKI